MSEEMKQFDIPVWVSSYCGNQKNCRYPDARKVFTVEELRSAVAKDHTFIGFKNNYRMESNFLYTLSLVVDCDNEHTDEADKWIRMDDIEMAFPDVKFVIYTSRNHMKEKGNKSARPRFHVIFFINEVTKAEDYKALLKRIQDYYPYFDTKALDAARFFYGNPEAEVMVQDGKYNLTQFFNEEDSFANMGEEIQEGNRNATMFKWAVRSMKRYGNTEESKKCFYTQAEKCNPPLENEELETIWRSAGKYYKKIASQPDYVPPQEYNKVGPTEWVEPIPFSEYTMMRFPIDALPKDIADYVSAVAESKEMREATDGKYPRYIVWENVPGAFSSNKGEDFKAVLTEICKIKDEQVSVSKPSKWENAGRIMGDGFSIAWRLLDAQYWGVPQRRQRIYLVADFDGGSAGKILFESEGLSGYSAQSFKSWQRTTCRTKESLGETSNGGLMFENHSQDSRYTGPLEVSQTILSTFGTGGNNQPFVVQTPKTLKIRCGCEGGGKGALIQDDLSATLGTNNDQTLFQPRAFGICAKNSNSMKSDNPNSGFYEADTSRTLDANGGNPTCNQGGVAVVAIEGNGSRPSHKGDGYKESDVMYTLRDLMETQHSEQQGHSLLPL